MNTSHPFQLKRLFPCQDRQKVLIVVLDGIGYTEANHNISLELSQNETAKQISASAFFNGNAVNAAYTPNLARLFRSPLFRTLKAHGRAVGLPDDGDMGNSEVGHNALGSGRVFDQGAKLVNASLASGDIFRGHCWQTTVARPELESGTNTLHFCGLLSDGNVHSHISHLFALIEGAKREGVKKVRLHTLLDGRDVGPTTALDYVTMLDAFLQNVRSADFDCRVASGGGRTFVTMDRYNSDWSIVERGYAAHVLGEGRAFSTLREAIETFRAETGADDQNLPPFVISENGAPVGTVEDNDSFIFFNFRGDRAIEMSLALTDPHFSAFPRKRFPRVVYAGMMQYDGDLKIPESFLVAPPVIEQTLTELLSAAGVRQFACSETQKYGHVTYFWNGNRSGKFNDALENYVEVESDRVPFEERPWMHSAEIADVTIRHLFANAFDVGRINFANGDMVGHTGNFSATVLAVAAVDLALGRLMKAAQATNTILLVTADHGNADEMFERDKKSQKAIVDGKGAAKPKTSHTLAPVPFALYNTEVLGKNIKLRNDLEDAGLANVAATVLQLMGFEAPAFYRPSLVAIP